MFGLYAWTTKKKFIKEFFEIRNKKPYIMINETVDESQIVEMKERYYSFTSARRDCYSYLHSEQEIFDKYRYQLTMHGSYPSHMADAMGDSYYYARFKTKEEGLEFVSFVRAKTK